MTDILGRGDYTFLCSTTNLLHKIANLSPSFWAEMKKLHYKKYQTEFR